MKMSKTQALGELYRLAMFGPGFNGVTFANVLLTAERALSPEGCASLSNEQTRAELASLRTELEARQTRLQLVHDALRET